MSVSGPGKRKRRTSYRPTVEALEALRLLSSATQSLPSLAVERGILLHGATSAVDSADLATSDAAWDAALTGTTLADLMGPRAHTSITTVDAQDIASGMSQLNRYLSRAWYRAGVPAQLHDDSTQAVYVALLQNLGRTRFDQLVGDIGRNGIRDVLSRETEDGPDFFRAIDTIKKRTQRERTYQSLDQIDVASTTPPNETWRGALQEAIDQSLTPREASLIQDTLMGKTPAEIASAWGVAPKTVSNEKTRVIQKLRDALVADVSD
jgi:RNA polymerase sigma factor (sigma-70 family)